MELYHCEAERVYAVTLSAELSGSHNSAELGRSYMKKSMAGNRSMSLIQDQHRSENL